MQRIKSQIETLEKKYECKLFNAVEKYFLSPHPVSMHKGDIEKENLTFSIFNLLDDCTIFIHDFFDLQNYFTLSQVCYDAFVVYFPFNTVERCILRKVLWSEMDNSLNGMISNGETTETANYMYRLFTFVNHMRGRRMMDPFPTLGCLLYKRYERSVEPLLILHALLFNAETIHRISVNIIKEGIRKCSFGINCDNGVLCFLMHSGEEEHFFIGEFVFCLKCMKKLRVDAILY